MSADLNLVCFVAWSLGLSMGAFLMAFVQYKTRRQLVAGLIEERVRNIAQRPTTPGPMPSPRPRDENDSLLG